MTMPHSATHFVNGNNVDQLPAGMEFALFGLGCFWGAERKFWQLEGVYVTSVGYAAGDTEQPTYKQVCSGMTNHNEVVRVTFDPKQVSYETLLKTFWESHNPTQGNRQGNDTGTQYRSGIYTYSEQQQAIAEQTKQHFQQVISQAGIDAAITTEIIPAPVFYFAEDYHQQYLAKEPNGYCGLGGLGLVY